MGTNYYFTPKKFELGRVKKLHEDYSSKLDKLLKNYIKSYNKLCNEMSKETNNLFESQELSDYNNWWNYMHLAEIEYPELHICKISMGWKPLFEATKFYGNVKELKEFYNKNKDRIHIEDEYGEEQDIDELFQFIDTKYKDKNSQSHTDAYKDGQGYEWVSHNFS